MNRINSILPLMLILFPFPILAQKVPDAKFILPTKGASLSGSTYLWVEMKPSDGSKGGLIVYSFATKSGKQYPEVQSTIGQREIFTLNKYHNIRYLYIGYNEAKEKSKIDIRPFKGTAQVIRILEIAKPKILQTDVEGVRIPAQK